MLKPRGLTHKPRSRFWPFRKDFTLGQFILAFMGVSCTTMLPLAIFYPGIGPKEEKETQKITGTYTGQGDMQQTNAEVWTHPFDKEKETT